MINPRQQAYLEAMDIGVWRLRETPACEPALSVPMPPEAPLPVKSLPAKADAAKDMGLKLGPGGGGILLVCAVDTDSSSRLANDICRAMNGTPVWAWPNADDSAVRLANAIEDKLFTTAAIFGDGVAMQLFDGELPASLNSANLVLLPAMKELQDSADARKALWKTLCRSGMVNAFDQQT